MSRIVHIFGAMDPGGAEVRMLELVRTRRQSSERHIFVTLSGRMGSLSPDFEAAGCAVVPHGLSWTFPFWFVVFLRRRGVTHLDSHVHQASGYFLALGWAAGISRRIAHLHTSADGRSNSVRRRLHRRLGHALLSVCATDIVGVSHATLATVMGSNGGVQRKSRVIYNQVDGSRFRIAMDRDGAKQAHILIVGRLDRDKNPLRVLDILVAMAVRHPDMDVTVQFVGKATPDEATLLTNRAAELGVGQRMSMLGVRNDIPDLMATSDLLVSTTLREGLPGAIIESSAAGLPSVVSAIPPNEEVASRLPSVVTVPLEASDEVWADVIMDVLAERRDRLRPSAVRAWFDASPFALADQKELNQLWS